MLGTCRDVVSERHILRRELRVCIRVLPYLTSKFLVAVLFVIAQGTILVFVVNAALLQLALEELLQLLALVFLTGATSAAIGLFISAIAPNTRVALTLVPILMIPQLLLGGLLVEVKPWHEAERTESMILSAAQSASVQRWAFEGAFEIDDSLGKSVVHMSLREEGEEPLSRTDEYRIIKTNLTPVSEVLFPAPSIDSSPWVSPWSVLAANGLLFLFFAWLSTRYTTQ